MNKLIVPTLFALDEKEFNMKLQKVKFSKYIHLDFMDGKFTSKKSVDFSIYSKIGKCENIFEVHLMNYNPEKYLEQILDYGIKKILLQVEVFEDKKILEEKIKLFKEKKIEIFLVINPNTNIRRLYYFIEKRFISGVMFMSVYPGKEGQKFISNVLYKIKRLKERYPKIVVQIDGGVSDTTISKISRYGVDIFSVGSYISSSMNPQKNYEELLKKI